jgi:hypothetical protein
MMLGRVFYCECVGGVELFSLRTLNCNESPIFVFPEKEFRGLSPNFHIYVSVID